jgi:uncharacterized membrane protein
MIAKTQKRVSRAIVSRAIVTAASMVLGIMCTLGIVTFCTVVAALVQGREIVVPLKMSDSSPEFVVIVVFGVLVAGSIASGLRRLVERAFTSHEDKVDSEVE